MEISWANLIYLVFGAIIGFGSSMGIKYIERYLENNDQKQKNKNILETLEKEIEEGIKRSEGLIGMLKNNKLSFSRIYTQFWTSTNLILSQNINNITILNLLHHIYYRFDLINFNMENGRFGPGAAFAKEYMVEIKENYKKLKKEINVTK